MNCIIKKINSYNEINSKFDNNINIPNIKILNIVLFYLVYKLRIINLFCKMKLKHNKNYFLIVNDIILQSIKSDNKK